MDAYSALKDFVEFWRDEENFDFRPNGNCEFLGRVVYSSPKEDEVEVTRIYLIRNGYDDGKIKIVETKSLSVDRFHLDFDPKFQEYKFRKSDGALVVYGDSRKMGGEYSVTMMPAI